MSGAGQSLKLSMCNRRHPNRARKCVTIVRAEEVSKDRSVVHFKMAGKKVKNKDGWFGKSDPFCEILRLQEDNTWVRQA